MGPGPPRPSPPTPRWPGTASRICTRPYRPPLAKASKIRGGDAHLGLTADASEVPRCARGTRHSLRSQQTAPCHTGLLDKSLDAKRLTV